MAQAVAAYTKGAAASSGRSGDSYQTRMASLVITVDCGSGSRAAVTAANAAGIDVIITDHHNLAGELPAAVAVVNP